ncbi:MAG: hypothetical protein JW908_13355 [Anaerolineales bacterium]|nr:hypothetical protein [Anaerolineales bacterium]
MSTISMKERKTKMEAITTKLIIAGILFLLTLVSGVIVSHSSRPYSIGLVTIHKLIAMGTVILIGMIINQLWKTADGKAIIEISVIIITGILFITLIATGALLTREEMQLPEIVIKIHKISPLLAMASSAVSVFLLVNGKS